MSYVYAKAFTEEELSNIISFYATPAGQKMIMESPGLTQASLVIMRQLESKVAGEVAHEMMASKLPKRDK